MTLPLSAVAGRFSTVRVGQRERTGQQVVGKAKLANQRELALAKASGFRALGADIHLDVLIHLVKTYFKDFFRVRK